jgi:FkbM family methyltransferase
MNDSIKSAAQKAISKLPVGLQIRLAKGHYLRQVEGSQISEEPDLEVLPDVIKPGFNCIDLGANIGRYTKHMSQIAGSSGTVLAVEPVAFTFGVLSYCVGSLGLKNVRLRRCAVSDHDGVASMRIPNIYEAELVEGNDTPVITLDRLAVDLRVDFVKCDVEGHELEVINGGRETIHRCKPAWLIETKWDSPVFSLMESLGYCSFIPEEGKLVPREQQCRTNYFFLYSAD